MKEDDPINELQDIVQKLEAGCRNKFIKDRAVEVCQIEGLECWVVPSLLMDHGLSGLNGYAVFPQRPVIEPGQGGILAYVPVHGGITYAVQDEVGMVYGFDTGHCDSGSKPRLEAEWIKQQIAVMIKGIRIAVEVEREYLLAPDNETKVPLCQKVLDVQPEEWNNFGVSINLLCGEL